MPPHTRWLIYDGEGSRHLLRLMHPRKPEILFRRGEELNLAVMLRALFVRNGSIADSYEDCYIRAVKPRVILTFIDNAPRFYRLANRHPRVKTMFIQNGWRGGVEDVFHNSLTRPATENEEFHVDTMCTYGNAIGAKYVEHIGGRAIAAGSLLSNECPIARKKKVRRLAYISIFNAQDTHVERAAGFVLGELKRYCLSRAIPLVVVARSAHDAERTYYFERLGSHFLFWPRSEQFGSYKYLDETEVSVSIDSSLGYETVARGNKNAFFSILRHFQNSNQFNFGWPASYPDEGPFWTNNPDPTAFERILDHLFSLDEAQWSEEVERCDFRSLVIHDAGNSIVKSLLNDDQGSGVAG